MSEIVVLSLRQYINITVLVSHEAYNHKITSRDLAHLKGELKKVDWSHFCKSVCYFLAVSLLTTCQDLVFKHLPLCTVGIKKLIR